MSISFFTSHKLGLRVQDVLLMKASFVDQANIQCEYTIIGLGGELNDVNDLNEQRCLDCIARHLDKIVGVKIRLVSQIANNGKHEEEAYRYTVCFSFACVFPPCDAFDGLIWHRFTL